MPIESITLDRFRNLHPVELSLSPQLNLFTGENAAGKTSVLEALYVLARGRSFRSRYLDKLVQTEASGFRLVAWLRTTHGKRLPIGMERQQSRLICRIDGQPIKRLSDLATLFPVQWLGGNVHAVIEDGPAYRRQVLDWGLFHVKPEYMGSWKRFQKLVKQRNAALRQSTNNREIQAWDTELAQAGEQLHQMRAEYLAQLLPVLEQIQQHFPSLQHPVELKYRRGWADDKSYAESLSAGLASDKEGGFTRSGPNRAELVFTSHGKPIKDHLSRGQQKLFVTALQVAQATLLQTVTGKTSLFLFDDLGAELDADNQGRVMKLLASIKAQVFVTAITDTTSNAWAIDDIKRFHVKHGQVQEVI